MKFTVTMKSPDSLHDALQDIEDEDEREKAGEFARQFMEYGEYITIQFDTEEGTAKVVK